MIENKETIKGNQIADILRGAMGHRATWTGLTYIKAKEEGKAEEAERIIRAAIAETGKIQGADIKAKCANADDVASFTEAFLNENLINSFEMEFLTKNSDRLDIEFHYCPLLRAWQDLGFDDATCEKLCDMARDGDRNIAKAMGYEFHLGDTIAKGCKTCQISFFKKDK